MGSELKLAASARPVRVSVPAKIAYDLDKFQTVIARLAEELGCTRCISGADCTFGLETDWVVNPAGELGQGFGR